jgi:signal transduction histidine kinase
MMYNSRVFTVMRLQITAWYVGVMGGILSLCGFGFYEMMAYAHWQALHQELQSVAGTLHDSLEPALQTPGQLDTRISAMIPGLCVVGTVCSEMNRKGDRHVLGVIHQEGYYARFLTQSGDLIATVGQVPDHLPFISGNALWQTLQAQDQQRYHQISLLLKTSQDEPWGYLQVGRSLQDFDDHLMATRWVFLIGLPTTMLLVTGASWWLAGIAIRPVYQSYQRIQQFTADAAHELRTPLAATRATVESALEHSALPETEVRGILQTVERQTIRLSQLVQDLLLLSRVDLQRLPAKRQICNLKTLICDVVDEFESLAIAHHLSLKTDIQVEHPAFVVGDEEQLYRLVANLVTNAIQYTPPQGTVTITLSQTNHHVSIQVQDTGIGIPTQEIPRIFDRFYRVQTDRSRHTGGAGLGLSIALAIAQAHRGQLQVQSTVSAGSVFSLSLPIAE